MPASDINTGAAQPQRPNSITTTAHPVCFTSRSSLPVNIHANRLQSNSNFHTNGNHEGGSVQNAVDKGWGRSIPEAGYITLGTLRYGVRLSGTSSSNRRLSQCSSCHNSDSIDTCSMLLSHQDGRPRMKADSPTCEKCCVGRLTNSRCCDGGSQCLDSVMAAAPQPRNSFQDRRRSRHHDYHPFATHNSAVTRLPFPKNRTSTLSPSQQPHQPRSLPVSPSIINSKSVEAHPASLLRVRPRRPSSQEALSSISHNTSTLGKEKKRESTNCKSDAVVPHLKPPVPRAVATRTNPAYHTEQSERSIGCFKLRQSSATPTAVNKSKVEQLRTRTTQEKLEKPAWLQICDPCHRMLERSLTPDISDLVLLHRTGEVLRPKESSKHRKNHSLDLELSHLRFIDSSSVGDLHGHRSDRNAGHERSCGDTGCSKNQVVSCAHWPNNEALHVNGWLEAKNPNNNYYLPVDESIIVHNKVLGSGFGERQKEVDDEDVAAVVVVDDDDDEVANNNLFEKEERRAVRKVTAAVVPSDRGLSREVTQLPHQSENGVINERKDFVAGVSENLFKKDLQSKSGSFEEDYDRCIQSINQQLQLECQDAAKRKSGQVTLIGDHPVRQQLNNSADQEEGQESPFPSTMDKRRNTFERFQRWGFGQRSASNNDLAASVGEPKKKDKSERLKDLTELLKGTRIPSLAGFHRNTLRESSCSPPPVPPPRRQRCGVSVEKSFEKLESIEDNESSENVPAKVVERKISVPSMKINDTTVDASSPSQVRTKPLHLSISSPHFRSLLERSLPPHTTDCNDIPVHAEELFSLPKVEPKTIIGSYAQKNIPYRSASFSQVDYNSGKYSLGATTSEETKHLKENRNSASVLESGTYPRRRGDLRLLRNMKLGSPGPPRQCQEQEQTIAEESSPSPDHVDRRMSILETIESYDVEESVSEDLGQSVVVEQEDQVKTSDKMKDECDNNNLDRTEDTSEETKNYQIACEIPTPVFECCGKEVDAVTEWFQVNEGPTVVVGEIKHGAVGDSVVDKETELVPSPDPSLCRVEVRKRNTFSSDSGNSKQSSLEKNDDGPAEDRDRKKIDKSRRRKGIYIQWPVTDKVLPGGGSSWDIDSPECDPQGGPLKLNVNLGLNFDCLSTASCEPLTPDSDNFLHNPHWPPKNPAHRKKSLTYQSSDEKDDRALSDVKKRSSLFRKDSTSDNESDRAHSRELRSVSPSREDLKRYSKRPLRGPYGQMLEAEMKKATKVHYDEILDDLRTSDLRISPRAGRSNVSHSLDESAKNANKLSLPRKSSAHLPIPFHERAASTPSQMDRQSEELNLTVAQKKFPNSVEKIYYEAVPPVQKKTSAPENRLQKSVFHSEATLAVLPSPTTSTNRSTNNKQCKRTASAFMDRSSRKRTEKAANKHNSELVETPRGPMASNDLLAELLKGSSEKHLQQNMLSSPSKRGASFVQARTLPQAVLKCLDTRTHVVIELFNTEQSYVDSLHTVITKYLNPLKSSDHLRDIVDSQLVDEIFYMVPSILGIHERFLEELHKRLGAWDCHQRVGDAFVDVFSSSSVVEIYTCFVNNWNKAKNAIRQASAAKPAFARFLESMAREHKGKLSLDNLLIKPVQKFPNYELILSRLIKHTEVEHPDQSLLQDANRLVHNILVQLNCKEREALENGHREGTLRELEVVIEGITDLVTAGRSFLLFDLVSMFSGQTTRKERGLFLFSDILVIASIKKRTGTIRKPATSFASTVAATLDTNKYKFLTKMPLSELEISKAKDESVRKMMREIEHLSEDSAKIQKIMDIMNSMRFPHSGQDDSMRDLQRDVQKQLAERQANDTQLSILEFNLVSSDINQNMSILFAKPEKRNQWEEAFSMAKQKLASSMEKNAAPEFVSMIPIRKTRAGLQFTCAASTIGSMNDVWVCNSDGYVGQVCVLSLYPEPTVTSCNGVCNARILCVTSVPPCSYNESSSASRESTSSSGEQQNLSTDMDDSRCAANDPSRLQLDSSSSSDNESDIEFSAQLNLQRDNLKEQSPALVPQSSPPYTNTMTSVASATSLAKSEGDEMDRTQSTMWLGTEDGCVHVYNCTDNIRIKKNKIKIQHSSAVYSILYLDNKVFVSLANGDICIYLRDNTGWNTNSPITISVGGITSPVTKLLNVYGKVWCAIQGTIKVLNVQQLHIESHIQISTESKPITNMVASSTNCVWISIHNSSIIKCYHSTGHELLFEIDVSNPVNKILSTCDDIIRQHKSACLRITSLLACKDLLWIGTSAGVLLNLPVSNSTKGLQHIVSSVTGISYGHTGHVRFLTSVELNSPGATESGFVTGASKGAGTSPASAGGKNNNNNDTSKSPTTLIISGGDGYEDFRSSSANSANDVAGREDSTNHLLLWQI